MAPKVEILPIPPLKLGEGPHWDIPSQSLYLVDLMDASLVRYDLATDKCFITKLDIPTASFIIPVTGSKGLFVVGCDLRLYLIKWDGCSEKVDSIDILYKVSADPKANKINDGKCDSTGRLWFGTLSLFRSEATGKLYSFSKQEGCRQHVADIGVSNGLSWDSEGNQMYYIDSFTRTIDVFDFNSNGSIENRRVLFDLKKNNLSGFPDGMTIDKVGNLWVAIFQGQQVININAKTGELIDKVILPTSQITSVAWGGPNLEDLYVTSGNFHPPEDDNPYFEKKDNSENAGCTFRVTGLSSSGLPMAEFKL